HAHTEGGTWPWHGQRRLRTSKHGITHVLRAGHGRGTMTYNLLDMKVANKERFCVSRVIGVTARVSCALLIFVTGDLKASLAFSTSHQNNHSPISRASTPLSRPKFHRPDTKAIHSATKMTLVVNISA
ncbi:hypothetical protein BDR03DRAFT_976177, partial [Suillus americanus]